MVNEVTKEDPIAVINSSEQLLFKPAGLETLVRRDGSILRFDQEAYENIKIVLKFLRNGSVLTDSQISLLDAIAVNTPNPNKEYLTFSELQDFLKISRNALRKRFETLRQHKIIEYIELDKSSCQPGIAKFYCLAFSDSSEVARSFNILREAKEDRSVEKQNLAKLKVSLLAEEKIAHFKKHSPAIKNINSGLILKLFSVFEAIALSKGERKKSHVAHHREGGSHRVVELSSMDNVLTTEDIQTIYALMTLTIEQFASMVPYLKSVNQIPENLVYVDMPQLLKILGYWPENKKPASSAYKAVRESMARVLGTSFLSADGSSIFSKPLGDDFHKLEKFTFFKKASFITKDRVQTTFDPSIGSERLHFDCYGYFLSWDDNLFKRILTDDFFFNLPMSVLASKTYPFLLYMLLRVKFSQDHNQQIDFTITDIYKEFVSGRGDDVQSLKNFRTELYNSLKNHQVQDDTFELSGYTILVDHVNGAINALSCFVDQKKMLDETGVLSDINGKSLKNPGRSAAPQSVNPLSSLESVIEARASAGEPLHQELTLRYAKNQIELKSRRVGPKIAFQHPDNPSVKIYLTAYSDDSEVSSFIQLFGENDLKSSIGFSKIKRSLTSLPLFVDGMGEDAKSLSISVFSQICDALFEVTAKIVERDVVFDIINSSPQIQKTIIRLWSVKKHQSRIIANIVSAVQSESLIAIPDVIFSDELSQTTLF